MEKEFDKTKGISGNMLQLFEEIYQIKQNEKGDTLTKESIAELCEKHCVSLEEVQNLATEIITLGEFKNFSDFQSNIVDDDSLDEIAGGKFNARKGIATLLTALSCTGSFLGQSSGAFAMGNDAHHLSVNKIADKVGSKYNDAFIKQSLYIQKIFGLDKNKSDVVADSANKILGITALSALGFAAAAKIVNGSKQAESSKQIDNLQRFDWQMNFQRAMSSGEITLNAKNYKSGKPLELFITNSGHGDDMKGFLVKLNCDASIERLEASHQSFKSEREVKEAQVTAAITMDKDVYANVFFGLKNMRLFLNSADGRLYFKSESDESFTRDANLNLEQFLFVSSCLSILAPSPLLPQLPVRTKSGNLVAVNNSGQMDDTSKKRAARDGSSVSRTSDRDNRVNCMEEAMHVRLRATHNTEATTEEQLTKLCERYESGIPAEKLNSVIFGLRGKKSGDLVDIIRDILSEIQKGERVGDAKIRISDLKVEEWLGKKDAEFTKSIVNMIEKTLEKMISQKKNG